MIYKRQRSINTLVTLTAITAVTLSGAQTLAAITKGYNTDDVNLKPGMVVSLSDGSTAANPKVERASQDEAERVIGVATTVDKSLVTIASSEQAVYVESDNEVDAYATDLEGDIKRGDLLTISPLRGILSKARSNQPVVAIALDDFSPEEADSYSVLNGSGTKDALVQLIRVNLERQASASLTSSPDDSALKKLGQAVVGKNVGEVRVVIALIILFMVLVAEGGIIYGAVTSGISSLGRNPLAGQIIRHELVRVLFVALAVLSMGIAAVYAVLWI